MTMKYLSLSKYLHPKPRPIQSPGRSVNQYYFGSRMLQDLAVTSIKAFKIRTRGNSNLTDRERQTLCLQFLFQKTDEKIDLAWWELACQLQVDAEDFLDALSCLILSCSNYQVAVYRLITLSPRWEIFFQRNYSQTLQSALRKLKLVYVSRGPVLKGQRKRGYADQGHLPPHDSYARRDAREHWKDLEMEMKSYQDRQEFQDVLALATGWSD